MSALKTLIIFFSLFLLGACNYQSEYDTEIRVTSFGIPHIKANDWKSLGYGVGYQFATDNLCVIAKHAVRVRGQLSKFFGPKKGIYFVF